LTRWLLRQDGLLLQRPAQLPRDGAPDGPPGVEASSGFKFVKYLGDTGFDIGIESQTQYEGGDGQDPGLVYKQKTNPDGQVVANVRPDLWTYGAAWSMGSGAALGTPSASAHPSSSRTQHSRPSRSSRRGAAGIRSTASPTRS
jgi:hypothetical protein